MSHIGKLCAVSSSQTKHLLIGLENKGLIRRSAHRMPVFFAVSPGVSILGLVKKEEAELTSAMHIAELLSSRTISGLNARPLSQSVVEIITTKPALREAVIQIQRNVKAKCLSMEKPPYLVHDPSATDNEERDAVARGVISVVSQR